MKGKNLPPFGIRNKLGKGFTQQLGWFGSQQLRSGQIDLANQPLRVEDEIADRGKIVEFRKLVPRQLQFLPGKAQLFVLHFQFDLVDRQFMDKSLALTLGPP